MFLECICQAQLKTPTHCTFWAKQYLHRALHVTRVMKHITHQPQTQHEVFHRKIKSISSNKQILQMWHRAKSGLIPNIVGRWKMKDHLPQRDTGLQRPPHGWAIWLTSPSRGTQLCTEAQCWRRLRSWHHGVEILCSLMPAPQTAQPPRSTQSLGCFQDWGIAPFPQHSVHLRATEGVKAAVMLLLRMDHTFLLPSSEVTQTVSDQISASHWGTSHQVFKRWL